MSPNHIYCLFTTEIIDSLLLTLLDLILSNFANMPYKVSSMFAPTTLWSQRVGLFTAWRMGTLFRRFFSLHSYIPSSFTCTSSFLLKLYYSHYLSLDKAQYKIFMRPSTAWLTSTYVYDYTFTQSGMCKFGLWKSDRAKTCLTSPTACYGHESMTDCNLVP